MSSGRAHCDYGETEFGPARVGIEKLRPAFDREDRVRPRPLGEGAALYLEKRSKDNVWETIPKVPPMRIKSLENNAQRAGLEAAAIHTLLAACPSSSARVVGKHTGSFDSLGKQRPRYVHSLSSRRERERASEHDQRGRQKQPSMSCLSGRALRASVNDIVANNKSASSILSLRRAPGAGSTLDITNMFDANLREARAAGAQSRAKTAALFKHASRTLRVALSEAV